MSYTAFTSAEIAAGEPVKQELWQKVKDNDADFDSRLGTAENSVGRLPPIEFYSVGTVTTPTAMDGALKTRIEANTTILAVRLVVFDAGSAGSCTVDVEYKRGGGAWTSVLSAPISASYSSGDNYVTSGTLVFTALQSGDLLRLNIDAVQTDMEDFAVFVEREVP